MSDKKEVSKTKASFTISGNDIYLTAEADKVEYIDTIPAGVYSVSCHPVRGYYITRSDEFQLPAKLYGETKRHTQRIISTFLSPERTGSTGVLMSGQKGSGKSLLAMNTAMTLVKEHNIPVIMVNLPYHDPAFLAFVASIKQPCCLMFDEFEKVYRDSDHQQAILTMLDGVFTTKKLFLMTVNSYGNVNQYMINRPGRLFYSLKFGNLSSAFITEYCQDRLNNKAHIEGVVALAATCDMTFDILKAIVEEMNRYNESAGEAVKMLNVSVYEYGAYDFDISLTRDGAPIVCESISPRYTRKSPLVLKDQVIVAVAHDSDDFDSDEPSERPPKDAIRKNEEYLLKQDLLRSVSRDGSTYVYATDDPDVLITFKRREEHVTTINYDAIANKVQ